MSVRSKTFGVVLTAREPISHHDPKAGNGSNTLVFLRQKQFVKRTASSEDGISVDAKILQHIADSNLMPSTISMLMERVDDVIWLSVAFVRTLLDVYNSGEGAGLLSGMERYQMLANRLETSAMQSNSLFALWSTLMSSLLLPVPPAKHDDAISAFYALPTIWQYQILDEIASNAVSIVATARMWHNSMKLMDEGYAAFAGEQSGIFKNLMGDELVARDVKELVIPIHSEIVMSVPAVSVNSLRHQLVREPSFLDLCDRLGIEPAGRGEGVLSPGVEGMFSNGGNIQKGVKQPDNVFFLAGEIRKLYPSLDLLGGTTSTFDIGESKLKVRAWIVCAENVDNLPPELADTPQAKTSVFEMLDTVTRTRMSQQGEGQMIYNYEVLVAGTKIYVELELTPYTIDVTEGALAAALEYYKNNTSYVGGQSARGHGAMSVEILDQPQHLEEYVLFVEEHKEEMLNGMLDGTMGTGKKLIK